jgi:hypothetical protein
VPLLFLALFFFYPLIEILRLGLAPEGQLDLSWLSELSKFSATLGFTIGQALAGSFGFIRGGSDTPKLASAWLGAGVALSRDGHARSIVFIAG